MCSLHSRKATVDSSLSSSRKAWMASRLGQEKIGWMVSSLFGLESLTYLTTGLVDEGVTDYSIESAITKVASTEFIWYAANRAFQLAGGKAYMRTEPYERILRDIRIFPIFEGANDV